MTKNDKTASPIKHIAIIMDGNRRFADKNKLLKLKGHEQGAKKVEEVLDWCKEFNIKELTLYTFSAQNFSRSKEEVNYLFTLFERYFKKFIDDKKIYKNKIKINFIGRIELFPKNIQKMVEELREKTKLHDKFILNFAFGYGGREEIVDAVKKIAEQVKFGNLAVDEINEQIVQNALYLQSEPEIVIRTSGEKRTSNFLLWQANYAEWFFIDNYWPEFSKQDFVDVLNEYAERERRFGK
ncbi:di-trans,poly-cis-decaprenylcistransferase [Candidatus Woesearchaeota archaeon]|nr:di-trans,poly-cis-decaprenylcistransferase [Candidatus Woesearchaeota archaeon]